MKDTDDHSRHVVLITNFYYPERTGIAVYTTGFAQHLVEQGYRVSVVTGFPNYPHWRTFPQYLGRVWAQEEIHGVRILRRKYYIPRPTSEQTALKRGLYELTFLLHSLTCYPRLRPRVVIAVVPNLACGVLAKVLAKANKAPCLLVFQDLTSFGARESGIRGGTKVASFVERLESWVARSAASVGIVAESFRRPLEEMGVVPDRLIRLRNWVDIASPTKLRSVVREELDWVGKFVCLHAGNIGHKQGLENVIESARLVSPDAPLMFVIMGDGNRRSALENLVASYGLANVRFLPTQSRADFANTLNAADVLLLNQRPDVREMSLPSKLTAYLSSGLPIIAAVSPESETAREILTSRAGVVVKPADPLALIEAVNTMNQGKNSFEFGGGKEYARQYLQPSKVLLDWAEFVRGHESRSASLA